MNTIRRGLPLLVIVSLSLAVLSRSMPTAVAGAAGKDAPKLAGVNERMKEFIADGEVAGAVTLVAARDRVVHLGAVGQADVAKGTPMAPDTIFWIASMTKPVTAVAVLMMQDEGKLSVGDPVAKYIPELKDLKTTDGKALQTPITIRHLLTHTSGMGESIPEESDKARTLADMIPVYASKPVGFQPGSQWRYSQSSINTAARVVEIVSGQSFPEFLQRRLFGPLGMNDTTFYLTEQQLPRLAKSYRRAEQGKLEEARIFILSGKSPTDRDRFPAANGGLFSTAPDYARFCQMLLNDGSLDGRQYLKPETVSQMSSLQTGELSTGFTPGNGWGLGVCVVRQPQGVSADLSPDSYGHGGAYGTQAWIDPHKGVAYVLMVQRANFPNSDNSDVRMAFQDAAAAALAR